jgi:hypothetical protein
MVLAGGPLIWATHFALMYGTQTAFCVLAPQPASETPLRVLGALLTAIAVAALVWLGLTLWSTRREADQQVEAGGDGFLREVGIAAVLIALLGVVWAFIPLLLLPACTTLAA